MSRVSRQRSLVARIVAPLLGVTCAYVTSLADDTGCYVPYPHAMPVVEACPPAIPCCPPTNGSVLPSSPTEYSVGPIESSDVSVAPTVQPDSEPSFSAAADPVSLSPEISPAPDFDLRRGLARNLGSGGAGSLAFADSFAAPGYIESAVIQNRVRIRYDDMQNATTGQRERAGYMYPTPSSFNGSYSGGRGPDYFNVPNELDVEELSVYMEAAFRDRFSIFIDVPFRFLTLPDNAIAGGGGDQRGVGDISVGLRWGLIATPDQHLTMQVRTKVPTGEFDRLLGTGNTSIDIGLLYDQKLGDRTRFYAELNDWQTLDAVQLNPGTITDPELLNLDANVLRYGTGLGYDIFRCGDRCSPKSVTALVEVVGWTVLDGNTPTSGEILDAVGDTIVNGKYGVRTILGQHSVYVGYGHNWTDDFWYSDLLRLEWQRKF